MKDVNLKYQSKDSETFQNFMMSEYNNISKAHFNTVNTISSFFRYYLLIVTVPISAVLVLSERSDENGFSFFNTILPSFACLGSFLIFFIGLCVSAYIINLRFDALLYARTVNGIRKYFYKISNLNWFEESRYRILPTITSRPPYIEWYYFYFVVLSLSFANGFYLCIFSYSICSILKFPLNLGTIIALTMIFSASISTGLYLFIARYRERIYLKRQTIGIDIDGVLNNHRSHFCKFLNDIKQKEIQPETITRLPIHQCETLSIKVDELDAHAVFNNPDYWIKMPVLDRCSDVIKELKNEFNYKIKIFTYRSWPIEKTFPKNYSLRYQIGWQKFNSWWGGKNWPIKRITEDWLKSNDILYDSLTIENSLKYTPNPKSFQKNRFQSARKGEFKIFIEDQIENAIRLSQFCDYVFLLDYPYNNMDEETNIKNIIRVKNWDEILDIIKYKL